MIMFGAVCVTFLAVFPDQNELFKDIVKALAGAAAVGIATLLLARVSPPLRRFIGGLFNGWRLKRARDAVQIGGPGLWLAIPRTPPPTYAERMSNGALVMTVANDKGGVGKTTVTANLACAFAARMTKPALVIDLDPQGTLSAQMFAGSPWRPPSGQASAASLAIDGKAMPDWLVGQTAAARAFTYKDPQENIRQYAKAFGLSAYYDLAEYEDRALVEWLIGDRHRDIRYDLFNLIRHPTVRERFGAILIDAPPRFSISSIQALCASSHVLIPTILDENSANAVGYFGKQLVRHSALWPNLKIAGILGTMTLRQQHEEASLRTAGDALRDQLMNQPIGAPNRLAALNALNIPFELPYHLSIPDRAAIGRSAGSGIAYVCLGDNDDGRAVREKFDAVAAELERRMR